MIESSKKIFSQETPLIERMQRNRFLIEKLKKLRDELNIAKKEDKKEDIEIL